MIPELSIALLWENGPLAGSFAVAHGEIAAACLVAGEGCCDPGAFQVAASGPIRVEMSLLHPVTAPGAHATIISIHTERHAFSFFLRDVNPAYPIFIPQFGVAVTLASDPRGYAEIAAAAQRNARCESQPEASCEAAAAKTRNLHGQIMLGISRDARVFMLLDPGADISNPTIQTWLHNVECHHPDYGEKTLQYQYSAGRGIACTPQTTRRLEEGVLPIVNTTVDDGEVHYHVTSFATLEEGPLSPQRGAGQRPPVRRGRE